MLLPSEVQISQTPVPTSDDDVRDLMEGWVEIDLQLWNKGIFPTIRLLSLKGDDSQLGVVTIPSFPFDPQRIENMETLLVLFVALIKEHQACAGALSLSASADGIGTSVYIRHFFAVPLDVLKTENHPGQQDPLECHTQHFEVTMEGLQASLGVLNLPDGQRISFTLPQPIH